MSKRVILVGHCSPDSAYLSITIRSVFPSAIIERAMDDSSLAAAMQNDPDLLLVNRVLDGEFANCSGIELIKGCRASHPAVAMMLISNYTDAQQQAQKVGAVAGFGKNDLNTPKAREALVSAMGVSTL